MVWLDMVSGLLSVITVATFVATLYFLAASYLRPKSEDEATKEKNRKKAKKKAIYLFIAFVVSAVILCFVGAGKSVEALRQRVSEAHKAYREVHNLGQGQEPYICTGHDNESVCNAPPHCVWSKTNKRDNVSCLSKKDGWGKIWTDDNTLDDNKIKTMMPTELEKYMEGVPGWYKYQNNASQGTNEGAGGLRLDTNATGSANWFNLDCCNLF